MPKHYQTCYRPNVTQKITATSTAAQRTTQMAQYVENFRIVGLTDLWFAIGSSTITATTTGNASHFVPAGVPEYFSKSENERYISVIANSGSGIVTITGMTQ